MLDFIHNLFCFGEEYLKRKDIDRFFKVVIEKKVKDPDVVETIVKQWDTYLTGILTSYGPSSNAMALKY